MEIVLTVAFLAIMIVLGIIAYQKNKNSESSESDMEPDQESDQEQQESSPEPEYTREEIYLRNIQDTLKSIHGILTFWLILTLIGIVAFIFITLSRH